MTIVLVGVPGSGKSTILKQVKHPSLAIVNYGEVMLQEASLQGVTRDELRKLPFDQQQEIGAKAALKIAEQEDRLTVVDTHACIQTPVGYCPGIPLKILNALQPKAFVLIETSPEKIVKRRAGDASRQRDQDALDALRTHQELTKAYLVSASSLTGAILCIVKNDSENIAENAKPLAKLIEQILA